MENKTFVEIRENVINIYLQNEKGKKDSFIMTRLCHLRKPFDGGTYQNLDLWRLYEAFACELKDGKMERTLPYALVSAGEWECALALSGTRDFHGGIHGYEHQKEFFAEADGKPVDLSVRQDLCVDEFRFYQKSLIVKNGTLDEPVCNHIKDYSFKNGSVEFAQEIEWLTEYNIQYAYLTMFPIRRTHDDTPTGEVISDRVICDLYDEVFDIEKVGHDSPISTMANRKSGVRWAKIWGEKSGFTAEVTIKREDQPDTDSFFVQNNADYNKLYFSYAGNGGKHNTSVGEKWNQTTHIELYRV